MTLTDLYLAWTDASDGAARQCPLDPSKIAPKCGTAPSILIKTPLTASLSAAPTCTGGSITVSASGGTGPYEYSINGGSSYQNNATFSGLSAGSYSVIVRDASSPTRCTYTAGPIVLTPLPTPAAPTVSVSAATCTAGSVATITSSTAGLEFSLDGGAYAGYPAGGYANLSAGPHTLRARSTDGCISGPTSFTIQGKLPSPGVPAATVVQPTCVSGSGTVNVTSPVSGVVYTLTSGGTTLTAVSGVFSNVAPGSYTLTATLGICSTSAPSPIVVNPQPGTPATPAATVVQPTCSVATGTVNITSPASGVTYTLTGPSPATTVRTASTNPYSFANLAPGTYSLTASNAAGCVAGPVSVVVNPQPVTPATPAATVVQPTCLSGSGTVTVTSPVSGVTYTLTSGGPTLTAVNGVFSNVAPGSYTLTATVGACSASAPSPIVVNPQPGTPAVPVATVVQPTCTVATGTISVSEPIAGYTYTLTGPSPATTARTASAAPYSFANLAPGTYSLTATTAAGCVSGARSVVVSPELATPGAPTATVVQPTCVTPTGTINVTSPNNTYTYTLTGTAPVRASITSTTGIFSGVASGVYNLTATLGSCTSGGTSVTVNGTPSDCFGKFCTLTQGGYGNANGRFCGGPRRTDLVNSLLAQGSLTIGFGSRTITFLSNQADCIIAHLPAGGTASAFPSSLGNQNGCTGNLTSVLDSRTDRFNNVLIGQTLTLSLNTRLDANLGGVQLTPTMVTYGATSCGNDAQPILTDVVTRTIPQSVITYLNATGGATVANLLNLANQALSGASGLPSHSDINAAVSAINELFDNCRFTGQPPVCNVMPPMGTVAQPTCAVATGTISVTAPIAGYTYTLTGPSPATTTRTAAAAPFSFANLAPGDYRLTATNAARCTSPPTILTVNPQPVTPATPQFTITQPTCTVATGSLSVNNPVAGYTYTLTGTLPARAPVSNTTGIFPNLPGGSQYSLTATLGACTSLPANIQIQPQPITPTAPAGTVVQPTCTVATGTVNVTSPVGGFAYYLTGTNPVRAAVSNTTGIFTSVEPGIYSLTRLSTAGPGPACMSPGTPITVNPAPICPIQGCTLGYWKNHTDRWCNTYSTTTLYGSVFTSAPSQVRSLNLLEALNLGGGGIENLARQSVAALLNICSNDVNYNPMYEGNTAKLIVDVNAAYMNATAGSLASTLDSYNNAGCPMGGTSATTASLTLGDGSAAERAMGIYPNPFSYQASVEFTLGKSERYNLQVLDMSGRVVSKVATGVAEAGTAYRFQIEGRDLAEGVYMVRLITDKSIQTQRLVLKK
ncbi:T9SS type A sorting domain-containing protein [Hymenobacter arizonensis]|uniref:T9SS type A sorting domain-containing protein n=1 Tax=Hymenobacter arizonensis TaxID=1227077 RepID=UPI0015A54C39|nr:T9SS type A sorting domain-containing protein [Hymenobacter arizonensis]